MNALQQFAQASSILRTTTRARNPGWYQEALDLNLQLHLRIDGVSISSFYFDKSQRQWSPGPLFTEQTFQDPSLLDAIILELLAYARACKAPAIGVILHIGDELATAELKPELTASGAISELREAAFSDPSSIIEDTSVGTDQASWRVIPYAAAAREVIGTTITVSRHHAPFFEALRQASEAANFPIISHALSAPMVAMMGLSQSLTLTEGKSFVAILQYPRFTVLGFFEAGGNLRLIRTMQHRGSRRPAKFRNSLITTNASLEFVDPDLFVVPLGEFVDDALEADLNTTFPTSRVEVIRQAPTEIIPSWCPEPLIAAMPLTAENPPIASQTFSDLREGKWALQNLLPTPTAIAQVFPDRSEMRLLRLSRLVRFAVFGIATLYLCYLTFGIFNVTQRPEWAFDPSQAKVTEARLAKFTLEQKRGDQWSNLLEDRSKVWTAMESLSQMFPKNRGMIVKSYSHTVKPEAAQGKATAGFIKEWKVTGLARDEALDYLNTINTREGIFAHFSELAKITGSPAYDPSVSTRNLLVVVRTQENSGFKPLPLEEANIADESTYPFSFDLTVTQRFEATDPLAIMTMKVP